MRVKYSGSYNQLLVGDDDQIFIYMMSGYGKSLAVENIAEEYHNRGYTVIYLTDVKDEFESCYAMFEPIEEYHLNELKKQGKKPSKKKVKIYHPFTFNIPKKTLLPNINFFTFSIASLNREEVSLLAETEYNTESIRLLMDGINSLGKSNTFHDMLHIVQGLAKSKKSKVFGREIRRPDKKNLWLDVSASKTTKSISDILSYFKPFKNNYSLAPDNFYLNLDFRKLLNDQEHYHCFVQQWIKDEKLKEFHILMALNRILENSKYARHPILIVIEEVRYLTPFKPQGYKEFLAKAIRDKLSIMRSKGRGINSIISSQVWGGVDLDVRASGTVTLIGRLGDIKDIGNISKELGYRRQIRELLSQMGRNCFLIKGSEDEEEFVIFFPTHCHAERRYNFFEMYKKNYPENMFYYDDLLDDVKKHITEALNNIKERVMKRFKENKKEVITEEKKKNVEEKLRAKIDNIKKEKKLKRDEEKQQLIKKIMEIRKVNPNFSYRQIGKLVGKDHKTVSLIVKNEEKEI